MEWAVMDLSRPILWGKMKEACMVIIPYRKGCIADNDTMDKKRGNHPMQRHIKNLLIVWLLVAITLGALGAMPVPVQTHSQVYIEPGLLGAQESDLSVIVTADDWRAAARAVKQVDGQVTSELWLIDAVGALVPGNRLEHLAAVSGVRSIVHNKPVETATKPEPPAPPLLQESASIDDSNEGWVTDYRFPVPWDGSPDVITTSTWKQYRLVYPTPIDVGTDQYQLFYLGTEVTVAVVDSGIYFDEKVKAEMGQSLVKQFLGQADFVEPTCGSYAVRNKILSTGTQFTDHCFTGVDRSRDAYGHGTHVAGIIWNSLEEELIGVFLGIAPEARILGVRVLDKNGAGTYETVIQGIQYVVAHKDQFKIRVLNLSLSAAPTTPYFVDPLDRAVEGAWESGIVVVAAAGNEGPSAETITVPGNDPYVITVGAVDGRRTPGYWPDDIVPEWSSSGPTLDGFIKPDVLAPGAQIISYMYNGGSNDPNTASLALQHPNYSETASLFRMNGTSMSTAVVSGVVARMLQAHPALMPDQVKYRLMATARQVTTAEGDYGFNPLQQGAGRVWAPDAVLAELPDGAANSGMDIQGDLAHGWGSLDELGNPVLDWAELSHHYLGPVQKSLSDDGGFYLYYIDAPDGERVILGATDATTNQWLLPQDLAELTTWSVGRLVWSGGRLVWSGGRLVWSGMGELFDASGRLVWSGGELVYDGEALTEVTGRLVWSGAGELFDASGRLVWSGGKLVWSGAELLWSSGRLVWSGAGELFDASGRLVWSGGRLVWSGGQLLDDNDSLVWDGGELFDASGRLVWSGGRLVWSGANLTWTGGKLADASGRLVWSGGRLVWSGGEAFDPSLYQMWDCGPSLTWSAGRLVWSGDYPVWDSGRLVWSGGKLVWSGTNDWTALFNTQTSNATATSWVEWK
jgi:hypothetical protein